MLASILMNKYTKPMGVFSAKTYLVDIVALCARHTDLMVVFGLVMEHDKLEIFHFSRAHNDSNPELDLSAISAPTLKPKTYWRYLGFYFN